MPSGQVWRRQLEKARLGELSRLGLSEPLGKLNWRIEPGAADALKRMGERGDIVKAMHRAMNESGDPRLITGVSLFDSGDPNAKSVTGKIIARGVADDVRDQAYVVIERAKDFSFVPWREVMDRNLGKQVSGIMRGGRISWTLTRGRGIE